MSCARLATAAGAVIALTAAGAAAAAIDPGLAATTAPHPTLTGSLDDALGILQNNVRVLAVPYLLWLVGFPHSRVGRHAGDLLMVALLAGSGLPVGVELGRWRARLLPYVPQLPVEWAALAVAITAWLLIRTGAAEYRHIWVLAGVTAALLVLAAGLETWATPHRAPAGTTIGGRQAETVAIPGLWVPGGCFRPGFCAGPAVSLQGRTLPSPCSARFRSPSGPALTGLHQPPPDPHKEGSR
jgi:hypothetical protein